jgi:Na+-translocating ferredoxin:NAD+ oxidoreductase RnfC subunit
VTVSIVGAVATPAVVRAEPATTMGELVARGGGALDEDWLPIAGGAPAGRLLAREATMAEAGMPSVVLVLPARHALVRRLRTTVGDWLWRAASACEGCRACGDACPSELPVHALVATLASGRDDGTAPARFAACSGCGVCDAVCPAGLSPRALAVDVRERLERGGVTAGATARRVGIDRALLTLRLGLAAYDREPRALF